MTEEGLEMTEVGRNDKKGTGMTKKCPGTTEKSAEKTCETIKKQHTELLEEE